MTLAQQAKMAELREDLTKIKHKEWQSHIKDYLELIERLSKIDFKSTKGGKHVSRIKKESRRHQDFMYGQTRREDSRWSRSVNSI